MDRLTVLFVAALVVALGVGVAVLAHHQAALSAAQERARVLEADVIDLGGQLGAVRAERDELEAVRAGLRAQIVALEARVGEVRVVERVRWRTREVGVDCPVPPADEPSPCEAPLCVYAEVHDARVETEAGNRVVVGEVELWRTWPPPFALAATAPFDAQVRGDVEDEAPVYLTADLPAIEEPARWGWGIAASIGTDGWELGPSVRLPEWRGRRWRIGTSFAAVAGDDSGRIVAVATAWRD